jgi:hypothetical protein
VGLGSTGSCVLPQCRPHVTCVTEFASVETREGRGYACGTKKPEANLVLYLELVLVLGNVTRRDSW